MSGHACAATGRGVIGRGVRFVQDPHKRTAHVVAVRCVGGAHSYRVRDYAGRIVVYHYFVAWRGRELSQRALKRLPVAAMMRYLGRQVNPPLLEKRTRWVPASALRFVRHDYTAG